MSGCNNSIARYLNGNAKEEWANGGRRRGNESEREREREREREESGRRTRLSRENEGLRERERERKREDEIIAGGCE